MVAVAFASTVKDAEVDRPVGVTQAYADMASVPMNRGVEGKQGSVYAIETENLAVLFAALAALEAFPWFPATVRDIHASRLEQWSDFTRVIKTDGP